MEYPQAEGRARYELGHLRAQNGDGEGAVEQLTTALHIFQQLGARPDITRAEQALAEIAPD
jgi:hypothetical protein